jgi:hypothetical protein
LKAITPLAEEMLDLTPEVKKELFATCESYNGLVEMISNLQQGGMMDLTLRCISRILNAQKDLIEVKLHIDHVISNAYRCSPRSKHIFLPWSES